MNSKRHTTGSTSIFDETGAAPQVESTGASILSGASSTSVFGGEIINAQRDHNRTTFIINIGGSHSDTGASHSTLAVSKPSTLGTVRNLPSTTSPASNQVQRSPEELSAFPDSGHGGSDVSSEIESPGSPPDEEENLVKEEPNAIYERHMYLRKHGFPLWIPEPNMRLSRSYRRQGVSIGDVGIFAWDGSFDFLFNVCLPAGHPNNPDELPEGFSCLVLRPADVSEVCGHSLHSHMPSTSVQKQDAATFECSGSEGAILVMPQGAYHEDLKNISRFRDYALTHAESWYQYANGPCGREIGNGELHMVTGCDKTTAWGVATYSHLQSKPPEGSVTLLSLKAVGNERHGQQPSYPMYAWDYKGAVEAKVGPQEDELVDLGVQGSAPPRNQCTFVRSLTPAFGQDAWERLQSKVAASAEEQALAQSPKNPFPSVLGAISSIPGRISSLLGHGRGRMSKLTDSVTPAQALTVHPATYVIDMILQKCPKAEVVVVHDSDWCSVIRDSDDDWTYTAQDLPRRIKEAFNIVQEKNGSVYLEKPYTSQLSTSTDDWDDMTELAEAEFSGFGGGDDGARIYFEPEWEATATNTGNPGQSPYDINDSLLFFFKDDKDENIKLDEHRDSCEDNKGQLDDEDNPVRDAALLDFIPEQFQKANNNASFNAQPSPLKTSIDAPLLSSPLLSHLHVDANDQGNNSATGTHKGITSEVLLLLDAPTQRQKYAGPSATSSKDLSTVLAGKRPRAEALEEEEDEPDADEPFAPNTTQREHLAAGRRKRRRC